MHSNIYQVSTQPIDKEKYKTSESFYEESGGWFDYIGDEVEDDEERKDCLDALSDILGDLFTPVGDGVFAYKGEQAMRKFKDDFLEYLRNMIGSLSADSITKEQNLYKLRLACKETHIETSSRFYIEEWNGYAAPFSDLVGFAESNLKEGDSIYIGAIIDYHF